MDEFREERILAIDFGTKRIGIAVTDPLMMFAYPLTTLNNDPNLWEKLRKIFDEYKIKIIVLGYPLKESGAETHATQPVIEFSERLSKLTNIPIVPVDERYSSQIAQQRIIETVNSKKKRRDKSLLDKNAACVILEDYLSSIK